MAIGTLTEQPTRRGALPPTDQRPPSGRLFALTGTLLVLLVLLAAVHLVQGTAAVGVADLVSWVLRRESGLEAAVVVESRIPRLAAALAVGVALGAAGCVLQSISRNPVASPDILAVNNGAHFALVAASVAGLSLPFVGDIALAFAGGLLASAVVIALTGTAYGTVRLVLGGTAVSLALSSLTTSLLILRPEEGTGLYAWASGSLSQNGFGTLRLMAPFVVAGVAALLMLGRRLDVMMLGDDEARALGIPVRRTQLTVLLVTVLMSAAAVAATGPIGFVGLAAPALARLLVPHVPGLHRHRALVPVSALMGVVVVLGADVALRAAMGAQTAVRVPTGAVTSLLGGALMVALALRLRAAPIGGAGSSLEVRGTGVRRRALLAGAVGAVLLGVAAAAALAGDRSLLVGDLLLWARGEAGPLVNTVLGTRIPRVVAALLAGVALAVAGATIQAVTRNPLADPSVIGVAGGASVGAVLVVTYAPLAGFWALTGAAGAGAAVAAAVIFALSARGGFASDRLVLVGVGVSYVTTALVTTLIVATDPFSAAKALTWLSGSTYGRSYEHLLPLGLVCLVVVPLAWAGHRHLDLISIDEDTPRVLGLNVPRTRLALLACGVVLTGTAVAAIGMIGFVGLVAPHAARTLLGRRHRWVIPVAALLGGALVVLADVLGRAVIAPDQLPAGLLTAVIGTPYFLWLLHRTRAT
ncbi:iron ABC transporter permease [Streptomyces radicis]|uniref:Iron ABC transporter permease n=1 Tax=Streptomyces radicis TaxID=1750517 RepID=A0A3A9WIH9_9ACTN|nr:iron ABC transporter permease [Streptomyces radicis]RKN12113.1 iron ABC transporter permease [Streptomyces radicis]RKN25834.1 iron ABC transporter permease [Streptomyces radicis]